jgi:uncharacterized protein YecT (DUF1311 family)
MQKIFRYLSVPLLLFLLTFHFNANADDGQPDCSNPITTNEVEICVALEAEQAQETLNHYLEKVKEINAGRTKFLEFLAQSQNSWEVYKANYCDAIYENWIEGSIRGAKYNICLKTLSTIRTRVIWQDFLTYPDGTPPVLPEPKI